MTDKIAALLARGGRILGLASVAHAKGLQSNDNPWHVLSDETRAAADQIMGVLDAGVDKASLSSAIAACMSSQPATAAPSWIRPLWENPEAILEIGKKLKTRWPPGDLGMPMEDHRKSGLAALAIALCRSMDQARAAAAKFGESDSNLLVEMTALAQASVRPGEPSEMRSRLKSILGSTG